MTGLGFVPALPRVTRPRGPWGWGSGMLIECGLLVLVLVLMLTLTGASTGHGTRGTTRRACRGLCACVALVCLRYAIPHPSTPRLRAVSAHEHPDGVPPTVLCGDKLWHEAPLAPCSPRMLHLTISLQLGKPSSGMASCVQALARTVG